MHFCIYQHYFLHFPAVSLSSSLKISHFRPPFTNYTTTLTTIVTYNFARTKDYDQKPTSDKKEAAQKKKRETTTNAPNAAKLKIINTYQFLLPINPVIQQIHL